MDPTQFIQRIHDTPPRLVLAATGGGSRAIADLLTVRGASRTVIEAIVPYDESSLTAFLGGKPEQLCSQTTARNLAMAAWQRARLLIGPAAVEREDAGIWLAGIGCTAALATDRPRRGAHRVHLAGQTSVATWSASLELAKGQRTRDEEEDLVAQLVLNQVAAACGMEQSLPLDLIEGEQLVTHHTDADPDWIDLLLGRIDATCVGTTPRAGSRTDDDRSSALVFPGAFNPLHRGHRLINKVAETERGAPVAFELSIENVDKPPLDYAEISQRLAQFTDDQSVWLTRAPTFLRKSQLFPAATFVVGADTIVRIADPRYYHNDSVSCAVAIDSIAAHGCRFLVVGRLLDGSFRSLDELNLPAALRQLCSEVPESKCRVDISSTELRRQSLP